MNVERNIMIIGYFLLYILFSKSYLNFLEHTSNKYFKFFTLLRILSICVSKLFGKSFTHLLWINENMCFYNQLQSLSGEDKKRQSINFHMHTKFY